MKKLILSISFICCMYSVNDAKGQAGSYIFSQSNVTYTPVTPDGTPAQFFNAFFDNNTFTYDLPFTFNFAGNNFTRITVSSNGFMVFGSFINSNVEGSAYVSDTNPSGIYLGGNVSAGGVAGFNMDLESLTLDGFPGVRTIGSPVITGISPSHFARLEVGMRMSNPGFPFGTIIKSLNPAAGEVTLSANALSSNSATNFFGNSSILTHTIGEAPFRTFVIQYTNLKRLGSSDTVSFQMRLNEENGIASEQSIEVVYGQTSCSHPTGFIAQTGIRTTTSDFNSRTTTTDWTSTTASLTNTDGNLWKENLNPPSGLTFKWSRTPSVSVDVGVISVIVGNSPNQIISLGRTYDVKVTIRNFGTTTLSDIPVFYQVEGENQIGPVIAEGPLPPNTNKTVIFSNTNSLIDLEGYTPDSIGLDLLIAFHNQLFDLNPENDSAVKNVKVTTLLTAFPHIETFDNPDEWSVIVQSAFGPDPIFGNFIPVVGPDNLENNTAAQINFFGPGNNNGRVEIIRSPEMDFSNLDNPVLNFYLSYCSFSDQQDRVEVLVSTDGGGNFVITPKQYNKTKSTIPSLATREDTTAFFMPGTDTDWRHESVSLSGFANKPSVVIAFKATSAFGNNGWIDNVIISNPNTFCESNVNGIGLFSCDSSVLLQMNSTPEPQPFNTENMQPGNMFKTVDMSGIRTSKVNIPIYYDEMTSVNTIQTDVSIPASIYVSKYLNENPGQSVQTNTTASAPDGQIYTPVNVYHDLWFNICYDGNDHLGRAVYDLSIKPGEIFFTNPGSLYIVKRCDRTQDWICLNTTLSGSYPNLVLKVNGLTNFSDFALAGNEALPVELNSFTASISGRDVVLNWTTLTEHNNSGFDIERSKYSNEWNKIGNINGEGNSNSPKNYTFTDRNLAGGKYNYRLKQIDFNGNYKYYHLSGEISIGMPVKFRLSQNYPNPFNPSTKIEFDLPYDSKVILKVYNVSGKEVAEIVNSEFTAGYHTVNFVSGNLSSGVYFYQIKAGSFISVRKMMLVR